jgi:predicted nucleic acid-binding protein
MARGILLDTSIWICYLRPYGWDGLKQAVQQVLTVKQVHTCWVVMAELLIGARDERGFTQLLETLGALPEIPVTDQVWEAAARLGYTVRRRGVTIPLPDLVIAQAAITGDLTLWHVDDHFEHLRRHSTLQTESFVPDARG